VKREVEEGREGGNLMWERIWEIKMGSHDGKSRWEVKVGSEGGK
jgi:hypothetical protein